jgi:hypothetical protein
VERIHHTANRASRNRGGRRRFGTATEGVETAFIGCFCPTGCERRVAPRVVVDRGLRTLVGVEVPLRKQLNQARPEQRTSESWSVSTGKLIAGLTSCETQRGEPPFKRYDLPDLRDKRDGE